MTTQSGVPPKVLVAKLGLDGHDVGAKVVARLLRDNGFEVIYAGIRQTPENIVNAALDEDVDVIGLSILSGAHRRLIPRVVDLLAEHGGSIPVAAGGFIPEEDQPYLEEKGLRAIFTYATSAKDMISRMRELAEEGRKAKLPSGR